jgi:hypothetical protein
MGSPVPAAPAAPDALRLTHCPACGYLLEGLPPEGVCPECGRSYDQTRVVLHGWARGSHATMYNAPPWVAVLLALFFGFHLIRGIVQFRRNPGWSAVSLTVWVVFVGWVIWRRRTHPLPGLVQVHLGPAGCTQIDNPKPDEPPDPELKWTPWASVHDVLMNPCGPDRVRLRVRPLPQQAWWKWESLPVDAEVRCTSPQSDALRGQIEAWRRGDGPPPARS